MEESKFNFSEEEDKEQEIEKSKQAVKEDARGLFFSLKQFIFELLDFRLDTDRDATVEAIKLDIPFKGATAWILICSIFVASIGLNANSTAVVIGAMLISALMGPILGVGLSIAINDIDTLSVFTVKWNDSLATEAIIIKDKYKLERWLKVKLNLDTLVVKRVN